MREIFFIAATASFIGCSQPPELEDNALGIAALQTQHTDSSFELRALDDSGNVVASVERRTGMIDGLSAQAPGGDLGSEVTITVGTARAHGMSHTTGMFMLPPANPELRDFLEMKSVRTLLEREGHIHVYDRPTASTTDAEIGYGTQQCPSYKLVNNGITAEQCCYASPSAWQRGHTFFKRPGRNSTSYREEGTACTNYDGSNLCRFSNDCHFGPNGFAAASFWDYDGYLRIVPNEITCNEEGCYGPPSGTVCAAEVWNVPVGDFVFGNVTGTSTLTACGTESPDIWSY